MRLNLLLYADKELTDSLVLASASSNCKIFRFDYTEFDFKENSYYISLCSKTFKNCLLFFFTSYSSPYSSLPVHVINLRIQHGMHCLNGNAGPFQMKM